MAITAAVVREQNVEFTVVLVKAAANQPSTRAQTVRNFTPLFPGRPLVLCSQDSRGVATYYGRNDLVNFLSHLLLEQLPWREYQPA